MKKISILFCFSLFISLSLYAQKDTTKHGVLLFIGDSLGNLKGVAVPTQHGIVNDFENLFTHQEASQLTNLVSNAKSLDRNQLTIITVPDYFPFSTIDSMANSFANTWEVGIKNKNGVVLIFSKEKKQARIQVGEGLKNKLNEESCQYIIQSRLIPEFRNKNFYKGTYDATVAILSIIAP